MPMKKPVSSSSLPVEAHSMFMLKKWQKIALERWIERPPKKITALR